MSNTDKPEPCNGAHCQCMSLDCPNRHFGDHACPYEPATPAVDGEVDTELKEVAQKIAACMLFRNPFGTITTF